MLTISHCLPLFVVCMLLSATAHGQSRPLNGRPAVSQAPATSNAIRPPFENRVPIIPTVRPNQHRTVGWQGEPEAMPAVDPVNPIDGQPNQEIPKETPAAEQKGPDKIDIIVPRGIENIYQLRVPAELGFDTEALNEEDYSVSQNRVIELLPSQTKSAITILGKNYGQVTLTLFGANGQSLDYRIKVIPSLDGLRVVLAKRFPNCNLDLEQVADNIIMVTGTIDSPAEVDPILLLMNNLVKPQGGTVINGLRIGGVMQVQLDVVVAYINRTRARKLGFDFQQGQGNHSYFGSQAGEVMGSPAINTASVIPGSLLTSAGGAVTQPLNSNSTIFFGMASKKNQFYAYLRALEENRCFKVMANPSLVTLSGRPATFIVGGKQPYPVAQSLGATSVNFAPFGTSLVFTPFVLGQGKIRLDMRPEVSRLDRANSVSVGGTNVPSITSQEIHATVEMESGQVLVLGGLLETQSEAIVQKVPILGDLPFAGTLFRKVQHQDEERELLVMATPHLISPLEAEQAPQCLPGDEVRSPTNYELFIRGMPEVPVGPCDQVQGARTQINEHQRGGENPYQIWQPSPQDKGIMDRLPEPLPEEKPTEQSRKTNNTMKQAGTVRQATPVRQSTPSRASVKPDVTPRSNVAIPAKPVSNQRTR